MNPYEKIQILSKKNGMTVRDLEKALGYANGYFSKWKKVSPNSDGISKVADYFNVSTDYLLGRTDNPSGSAELPLRLTLDDALAAVVTSNGEPLTKNDMKLLKALFNAYIEQKSAD